MGMTCVNGRVQTDWQHLVGLPSSRRFGWHSATGIASAICQQARHLAGK
jgi:hypothetical protein